jgi:cytochrome c
MVLLALMFSLMGNTVNASSIKVITQDHPSTACFKAGVEDVVDVVNKAIKLLDEQGPVVAFRQIMEPAGGFIKGDLYLFVLDQQGIIVANGAAPESIGSNSLAARDQDGYYFIKDILQQASTHGTGWVRYDWYSPCTGKMAAKQVFFKKMGQYVVCAGYYKTFSISRNSGPRAKSSSRRVG